MLYFTCDYGTDTDLVGADGIYLYPFMLTTDEGENYFKSETGTFIPKAGKWVTDELIMA